MNIKVTMKNHVDGWNLDNLVIIYSPIIVQSNYNYFLELFKIILIILTIQNQTILFLLLLLVI